ncbi:MAG: PD40 domain-containing protein [Bacteroidetes bacterium]|nr:PD40 domain-containing protein [Bacteroidota bacterium]
MKNQLLLLLLSLAVLTRAHAQQYNPEKVSKKAGQYFSKATELAQNYDLKGAIDALKQAINIDPRFEDAWLSLGGMYGEQKNYPAAVEAYEKARAIDSVYFMDYNLPYSIDLAGKGDFAAALQAVTTFLTVPNLNETSRKAGGYRKRCYQFALDYAAAHPVKDYKFDPVNMGDSINSEFSEYYPTITIDGNTLIYTRRVNHFNEDFYQSNKRDQGWSKSRNLPGNINTNQNEGAQNISQDGQWLIFTGCNFPDGRGSCDLYISYLTADGWSTPENMGDSINTEYWESAPSLSPDKRDLYFSSQAPGGYGGSDLYVTHHLKNGQWSTPENLGPSVNTVGDEGSPFIHPDNQTLYFTSNGHPGYGDNDLFVTRKGPQGVWSKPENLGYPINTIENEGSLVVAANGKTAYYASDRSDTRGGLDLYSFDLRQDIRPAQTLWVKGKVFDRQSHKGLPSNVVLTDLSTREVVSNLQTDETGNYLVTLPKGKDYAFNVKRKGYLFFSDNFSLSHAGGDTTFNIDIPLQPIEANAAIVLNNIFFETNKYELKSESQTELDEVVQLLKDNPTVHIQIDGHTDNVGKAPDNKTLSENRAKAVTTYLVNHGINAQRLSSKGFGDTMPVADNATPDGRAKNRRTELKVISR